MQNRKHEIGIGENSGPACKYNHDKAGNNFIDVIKVSRAQHIALQSRCLDACCLNPLPAVVQSACKAVTIPFFHIVGMCVRFYLLLLLEGQLYALWEWASEMLPVEDVDIEETLRLCKSFLIYRVRINFQPI
jgi:hypothetical protein